MEFIPDIENKKIEVPYFEDADAKSLPGYSTGKSQIKLQSEIVDIMIRLGCSNVIFAPGHYPSSPKRYGFVVAFLYHGNPAKMKVAAAPIRKETKVKKEGALRQCLYVLRDWFQSELNSIIFRPGSLPLMAYLLVDGENTFQDTLIDQKNVPALVESLDMVRNWVEG